MCVCVCVCVCVYFGSISSLIQHIYYYSWFNLNYPVEETDNAPF